MMNAKRRRNAFTLIEVLIVVVIMAVLAATVIPQFTSSTKDAQNSSVEFNARTLRAQIELYAAHHNGTYPTITDNSLPQLTSRTNVSGQTGTDATAYPFGPYVPEIPKNPFNNKTTVAPVASAGTVPNGPVGDNGWQYDATTGGIWPSHTGWTRTTAAQTPSEP